jgi:xylulokinase
MSDIFLLGIDFGTGGCKITIINQKGEIQAESSREYIALHPQPSFSEQNPDDWFTSLISCFAEIRELKKIDLKQIKAVALDGSTHNAVLLDRQMKVIRPAIMWTDQRSSAEVEYLEKGWGSEIFRIAYQKVAPTWTLPQLLWIKNNEPSNFRKIHRIMFVKDYIRYLLTGSWETDYIEAQGTMFFDIDKRKWSEDLCKLIDLPLEVLPPLCLPTDITGKITAEASYLTGLAEGTAVVCGTSDSCIEDYGAGAISPGQCIIKLATAGNVNVMTSEPNPSPLTLTYSHVVPGLWYSVAATNTAASAMRWFRDNFCLEEIEKSKMTGRNVYQIMEELIIPVSPGSNGLLFHPYLLGERAPYWDPYLRASFIGASMAHKKGHFLRALMEGVAFSLKDCFRLIENMNIEVTEFIIIGGGSKSDTWAQIVCDIFGKKVIRPSVTDASYGSALLAGVGVGVFSDVTDAAQKCIKFDKIFEPDLSNHKKYNEIFGLYLDVHDRLKSIYQDINRVIN